MGPHEGFDRAQAAHNLFAVAQKPMYTEPMG